MSKRAAILLKRTVSDGVQVCRQFIKTKNDWRCASVPTFYWNKAVMPEILNNFFFILFLWIA